MKTKQCVILLDFDGPMIPMRAYFLPTQTNPVSIFDPCAVALLNRLIAISQAKIVISSTWGRQGLSTITDVLAKNNIDPSHLHEDWITPRKFSSSRSSECKWWLDDHPEVTHYVALDDEQLNYDMLPHAIQCDPYEGFSWRNYLECCLFLDSYQHDDPNNSIKFQEQIKYHKRREIWRTKRGGEPGDHLASEAATQIFPHVDQNDEN